MQGEVGLGMPQTNTISRSAQCKEKGRAWPQAWDS